MVRIVFRFIVLDNEYFFLIWAKCPLIATLCVQEKAIVERKAIIKVCKILIQDGQWTSKRRSDRHNQVREWLCI